MAYHVSRILAMKPAEIEKMSLSDLRKKTTILNSAANKRIKRAYKQGVTSTVLDNALDVGKFKTTRATKGMSEEKQRKIAEAEFMRAKLFLESKTSSVRGIKKTQKKVMKAFTKKINKTLPQGEKINPSDWYKGMDANETQTLNDLIWTQVDKLAEKYAMTKEERYRTAGHAYEVATRSKRPVTTKNSMFKNLLKWRKKKYEEESGSDLVSDVGDDEIAAIFKNFDGI